MESEAAAAAAAAYKAAKEAWVTGNTGGSMAEATLVTASALSTFILWTSIQKYHPHSPGNQALATNSKSAKAQIFNSPASYLLDFSILVIPQILGCTVFADYAYLWSFALLAFAAVIRSVCGPADELILKKEKKRFKWKDSDDEFNAEEDDNHDAKSSQADTQEATGYDDGSNNANVRQRTAGQRGADHAMLNLEDSTASGASKRSKEATREVTSRKIFLSVYRAGMMILTCIAILAVDFPIFPRRFSKVEVYGTSLMDLGVGSFVFSSGVVSARGYLKKETMPFVNQMMIALRTAIPLLVLGLGRFISTKGVDYQEHVTEYGMHWNFFFTLGFLPIFVTLFRQLAEYVRFSIVGSLIAVVYQWFLTYGGLEDYIQNAPRVDLISMNKEGIFSFAGYLAIFLVGIDVGLYVLPNDPNFFSRKKSSKRKAKRGKLAMILLSLGFLLCMGFLTSYGILRIPVSRQMANLSYFFWVITFNTGYILSFLLAEIAITKDEPSALAIARAQAKANLSTSSSSKKNQRPTATVQLPPLACPTLIEAVNRNGLAVFLVANVLTGLVNLSIKTLYTQNYHALAILTGYMALVTTIAWTWQTMGWKLKL
ncbi:Glucosaminyl phosphatidylinositol (GlcN-PI) nositol acylation protein [Lunasporangiospora selenospora]|uniref:GPI-anchored wall transfer protein n=1 Tax=Lunasporangiospora selenospora TaxID=979761 RepID=A0A9P6KDP9_9FUNG|nr:Glucosaminyl phosphatidylinositol (GlcN-PI) nositol acylation protein [Lunasporangiospora selenospora]